MLDRFWVWALTLRREDGQAMAEYGLILALVAVVAMAALTPLGTNIYTKLQAIADAIGNAAG